MSKPKFTKSNKWPEYEDLQQKINSILQNSDSGNVYRKTLFAASILFLIFTSCVITKWVCASNLLMNVIATLFLGILTVPMVLVIGHEATHENFSTSKTINSLGKSVFYFLGTTPYFWELRHIHAHHPFTNIKKWDLDIEQSQAIRLDDSQTHHARHKYQPYYMPFLFLFYSLNWFFIRDIKDINLFTFGIKKLHKHPTHYIVKLFIAKLWHFSFLLFIPVYFGQSWSNAIFLFFLYHFIASITTTITLISTHIGYEHELLAVDTNENFNHSWIEHQIKTTGDFCTNSNFILYFFGGFNHHLAHHLFPKIPFVLFPQITPLIRQFCNENNLPYKSYSNIFVSAKSHFKRLKKYSFNEI